MKIKQTLTNAYNKTVKTIKEHPEIVATLIVGTVIGTAIGKSQNNSKHKEELKNNGSYNYGKGLANGMVGTVRLLEDDETISHEDSGKQIGSTMTSVDNYQQDPYLRDGFFDELETLITIKPED